MARRKEIRKVDETKAIAERHRQRYLDSLGPLEAHRKRWLAWLLPRLDRN
jgi:hypothetical protein